MRYLIQLLIFCLVVGCAPHGFVITDIHAAAPIESAKPPEAAPKVVTVKLFSAGWCLPCRPAKQAVKELNDPRVEIVDFDENKEQAAQYKISHLPTYILLVDGVETDRKVGPLKKEQLKELLDSAASVPEIRPPAISQAGPAPDGLLTDAAESVLKVRGGQHSYGSGVVVKESDGDYLIVTAAHVLSWGRAKPSVLIGDKWYQCQTLKVDVSSDLVLMRLPQSGQLLRTVDLADSPRIGARVVAVGYPRAGERVITETVVIRDESLRDRTDHAFIPGESGGAVLYEGKLVGIISQRTLDRQGNGIDGIYVDVSLIKRILNGF